jgi:hypothetical protein
LSKFYLFNFLLIFVEEISGETRILEWKIPYCSDAIEPREGERIKEKPRLIRLSFLLSSSSYLKIEYQKLKRGIFLRLLS